MARRQLLTDEQWTRLLAPPSDEREIVRYWTLSREDFKIIFRKRSDHSRLGFALLLCALTICHSAKTLRLSSAEWFGGGATRNWAHRADAFYLGLA